MPKYSTPREGALICWHLANAQKPDKNSLLHARSLNCKPEHVRFNEWLVPSTRPELARQGVKYDVKVFYTGDHSALIRIRGEYIPTTAHGLILEADCTCPDFTFQKRKKSPCKHGIAVLRQYESNFMYLFDLFGLPRDARFGELRSAIRLADEAAHPERKAAA